MIKTIIALAIIVYYILLIVLVININEKSKVIKYSFLACVLALMSMVFIVNELIMDYLISFIIKYIYFPPFEMIIATVMCTLIVYVYNIFKDELNNQNRIINYIFASYIIISFIIFMIQNVDIYSYNDLYSDNSLICLRYISRTFLLWIVVNAVIKYFRYFMKRK